MCFSLDFYFYCLPCIVLVKSAWQPYLLMCPQYGGKHVAAIIIHNQCLLIFKAAFCFIWYCEHRNEYGQLDLKSNSAICLISIIIEVYVASIAIIVVWNTNMFCNKWQMFCVVDNYANVAVIKTCHELEWLKNKSFVWFSGIIWMYGSHKICRHTHFQESNEVQRIGIFFNIFHLLPKLEW